MELLNFIHKGLGIAVCLPFLACLHINHQKLNIDPT